MPCIIGGVSKKLQTVVVGTNGGGFKSVILERAHGGGKWHARGREGKRGVGVREARRLARGSTAASGDYPQGRRAGIAVTATPWTSPR